MEKEKRPKMYVRLEGGYVRINSVQDRFMTRILHHNRSLLHKVLGMTVCVLFGHPVDEATAVSRGFTNRTGEFMVGLCKRCRISGICKERGGEKE